ncbi:GreA/GreB family elongation factor [Flavobacteriales bacterium]|nr:GreA/GreB family elongation factor [Flavobacteriales bacterium]
MNYTKQDYINACEILLKEKINGINGIMNETQSSANTDTKSSAGDKHETSRAMAHLENERLGGQLNVLKNQLETIYSINPKSSNSKISLGSIIECQDFIFFISTGLGKIKHLDRSLFFAIANDSPIAINLKNKKVGDEISIGNKSQTILNIS